ncbi:MAG TPA: hypothetical protein VHN98_13560, partial [Acidimicrobiales bacterium]|nr:hypothetical protein [Acidimicrobiales bacterium]
MDAFARVVSIIDVALFGGLALVCVKHWRARRDAPARWLAITFGVLAAAVLAALPLPSGQNARIHGYALGVRLVLLLIFAYPYALFRFGRAFRDAARGLDAFAASISLAVAVAVMSVPLDADPKAPKSAALLVVTALVGVQWVVLSALVAVWLWSAGGGLA